MTTVAGAVFVGVAATALFAAPASATTATVVGDTKCADDGKYAITWTITSDYPSVELTITDVKVTPDGPLSQDLNGKKIKGQPAFVKVTQAVAGTTTKAELSFHPVWGNGHEVDRYRGSVQLAGTCKAKEQPVPPTTPATPTTPAPAPSKSSAAPALPVTGAQTGLYAGGAVVLLAAGGGLFLVARRRRLKFEA
jgi:LPXTG-motif cell wall-anchored protein